MGLVVYNEEETHRFNLDVSLYGDRVARGGNQRSSRVKGGMYTLEHDRMDRQIEPKGITVFYRATRKHYSHRYNYKDVK